MEISEFKLKKNRMNPEKCYSYEKSDGLTKHSIFTMNGGKTFLASIQEKRGDGRFYDEFSQTFSCKEECLNAFELKGFERELKEL